MSTKIDRKLDTIAKLLAKAESTQYPAEAQAYTEHAQRLMVRYGIDKAAVDAERGRQGRTQEAIIEFKIELSGVYKTVQRLGLQAVMLEYKLVKLLQQTGRLTDKLYVIGAESDVKQMVQLADSLKIQQTTAVASWWARFDPAQKSWMTEAEKSAERREFALAFYTGAAAKLHSIMNEESEATGTELVLVARKERADAWAAEQYPNTRKARAVRLGRGSAQASQDGHRAGLSADVNGRKVSATPTKQSVDA